MKGEEKKEKGKKKKNHAQAGNMWKEHDKGYPGLYQIYIPINFLMI